MSGYRQRREQGTGNPPRRICDRARRRAARLRVASSWRSRLKCRKLRKVGKREEAQRHSPWRVKAFVTVAVISRKFPMHARTVSGRSGDRESTETPGSASCPSSTGYTCSVFFLADLPPRTRSCQLPGHFLLGRGVRRLAHPPWALAFTLPPRPLLSCSRLGRTQ